jgi:hypothetical protein
MRRPLAEPDDLALGPDVLAGVGRPVGEGERRIGVERAYPIAAIFFQRARQTLMA